MKMMFWDDHVKSNYEQNEQSTLIRKNTEKTTLTVWKYEKEE